jgi:hypothetical protein
MAVVFGLLAAVNSCNATELNTLTAEEKAAGWCLLWDGKTTNGWESVAGKAFPDRAWEIKDDVLSVVGQNNWQDIVTVKAYGNFELRAEFRITPGANSGIKYFINPGITKSTGCEFQILDDERHPDAKQGINGNRTVGSLYDLITACKDKKVNPPGEWNEARILVRGAHVEHWLNGQKVVEYDRGTPAFQAFVAKSKFKKVTGFGQATEGRILLQDHNDRVSFRNLKIRELPAP